MIYTYVTSEQTSGRSISIMVDSILTLMKKALSLVSKLVSKIVNIDSSLKVVGYASGWNEVLSFQLIDNGMYEMEKKEGRDLSPDDDSRKTGDVEDVEENIDKRQGRGQYGGCSGSNSHHGDQLESVQWCLCLIEIHFHQDVRSYFFWSDI